MIRHRTASIPGTSDMDYGVAAEEAHLRREKAKARELRQSQWWKNRRGQGRCHYCGQSYPARELTMDHMVPIARGGRSVKSNVVPCCKTCNSRKQSLLPSEWQDYLDALAAGDPNR